jgi:hypothetical protein
MASSGQLFSLLLSLPIFLDAGSYLSAVYAGRATTARSGFHHLLYFYLLINGNECPRCFLSPP